MRRLFYEETGRIARFALTGLAATAAHYGLLVALVELIRVGSVGLANGFAAAVGITVSYLGNRSFVMRSDAAHALAAPRFVACYGLVIGAHGGLMALWADWAGLSYSVGFVVLTAASATATYLLNRYYVFRA